jgi:hypothetical protein
MKTRFLRRFTKFAILVVLAAVVLTGAARVGVSRYLASARGKALVSDRIGNAIGMPVEVSELDVGDDRASFRFRVMDPGNPEAEVFSVPSASADVSASDLMTGRVAPSALRFNGASLTLRVNTHGQVTTPPPALPGERGTFPAFDIEHGRVRIFQEGRPDFIVHGVSLKVEPEAKLVALTGAVSDPKWGEWTIRGEFQRDTRTGWVELTSPNAPLDRELLSAVPFAPPGLFDNVPVTGRASVKLRLTIRSNREVDPSVEIGPALKLFGTPLGRTYRLYYNGDHVYFER